MKASAFKHLVWLLEVKMTIEVIGGGERIKICARLLAQKVGNGAGSEIRPRPIAEKNDDERQGRLIILPIPTTRDKMKITGTDTYLSDFLLDIQDGDMIGAYALPEGFAAELHRKGAFVYDAALDESFLKENAKITAHGTLGRILTETEQDLSELSVGIIGYGRIGSALAELLMFVGSRVRLYSTSREKFISLGESGVDVWMADDISDFSGLDILVNTAPKRTVSEKKERELILSGVKIIELASGNNFTSKEVVRMPAIPDRMYPISAGRLYAKHIFTAFFEGEF